MHVLLGMVIGSLIGWAACALLRMSPQRGVLASLLLGAIGGGIGMQAASMIAEVPGIEEVRHMFSLIMTAATASACLIAASMIDSH